MAFKLSLEQIKNLACDALRKLDVCSDYIRAFRYHGTITMFINGAGYFIDKYTEDNLLNKIQEIEQKHCGRVYAVVKNKINADTIYTFLWISEKETENNLLTKVGRDKDGLYIYETFVYGYNASCEYESEFGYACIIGLYGGIKEYV